jgi:cyclic pyranopterin phosphate synthase
VRASVALGITKIRLTGGEPLVRRDIVEIIQAIAAVDGVSDLSMTTNGFRLAGLARSLKEAGLQRINISLDSLRREKFAHIIGVRTANQSIENVRMNEFNTVWAGIQSAEKAGLAPLKLNCVVMRNVNDDEVEDFGRLTVEHAWHVRFIELMPVGQTDTAREFFARHFIAASELMAHLPGLASDALPGNGPTRTYRLPNARGTIGLITPASKHFCNACNRIRVTARGALCACLFGDQKMDLRNVLCEGVNETALAEFLARAIDAKPERHPLGEDFRINVGAMSQIGG